MLAFTFPPSGPTQATGAPFPGVRNGRWLSTVTLICEAEAPFTQFSTNSAGVPLAADGDFQIDDVLTPAPPADCASPVLLIRTTVGGGWFAAGIPKLN